MAGHGKKIIIKINKHSSFSVTDDGKGTPVEINSKTKKSYVKMVFTGLHAGGKFNNNS